MPQTTPALSPRTEYVTRLLASIPPAPSVAVASVAA